MKLTAAKIKECAAWVEAHGLYPQACGSSIGEFAKAMGINDRTVGRWMLLPEMSEAIERARELFAAKTVRDVENALIKAAKGVDYEKIKEEGKAIPEVIKEYDPQTGKLIRETTRQKMVTVKAVRERVYFPPDVKAATLVLTNMAPDKWKQKQDVNVGSDTTPINISVGTPEAAEGLRRALETGAQPVTPEGEAGGHE